MSIRRLVVGAESDGHALSTITSDIGQWSIVPRWLIDAGASSNAIKLYAILGNYADADNVASPGRKELARRMGKPGHPVSVDTVDRTKQELVDLHAIEVAARYADNGDRTSNRYILTYAAPDRRGGRSAAVQGGRSAAAGTRRTPELEATTTGGSKRWPPKELDGRRLTDDEVLQAGEVLVQFNDVFGKRFTSSEFLRMIVLRAREHPEMTVGDFRAVIEKASRNRWWERNGSKGDTTPNVVFGNAQVFERTMNRDEEAGSTGGDDYD